MQYMKFLILTCFFLVNSFIIAGFQNEETTWTHTQSLLQGFYIFESTQIDRVEVESGNVIGAFNGGFIC